MQIGSNRTLLELKFDKDGPACISVLFQSYLTGIEIAFAEAAAKKESFQSYLTGIEIHEQKVASGFESVPIVPYWN